MRDEDKEYEKFIKLLSKELFSINDIRKFVDNEYVQNISFEGPDPKRKNYDKYAVKLVDGDVYYVYSKF